jgi:K+-sensing histidine kinase KdpD
MRKRWQDVMEIIEAGINVISAVNIQHIDSLSAEIRRTHRCTSYRNVFLITCSEWQMRS